MRSKTCAALVAAAIMIACAAPATAQAPCTVIDTFMPFMDMSVGSGSVDSEHQAAAFRDEYLPSYAYLYTVDVIPLPEGAEANAQVIQAMAQVRAHPELRRFDTLLAAAMQRTAKQFRDALPDFRCDFPVYTAETFGFMDGAGRVVRKRPALVLGVDTIAQFWTPRSLPVLLSHELFHRYHFQAAGFSDDLAERDLIWRSLWAEGLATYVSSRLNPSNPLREVLMVPSDLEERAKPLVAQMAIELLASADTIAPKSFGKFFVNDDAEAASVGWPPRSGYYIGYLVAKDLGRSHSLAELAHMKGPGLRTAIGRSLKRLSTPAG